MSNTTKYKESLRLSRIIDILENAEQTIDAESDKYMFLISTPDYIEITSILTRMRARCEDGICLCSDDS